MIELKTYNGLELAQATEIHFKLGIRLAFSTWFKRSVKSCMLDEHIDFFSLTKESTGGRPSIEYYLTKEAALSIIAISRGEKAKEVRLMLIDAFNKRQELEYITPKEAALAYEYINFFKYIENQKQAYVMHKDYFVSNSPMSKFIYAEFAKHRENITGWNKEKVNDAIVTYLKTKAGHNFTRLIKLSMSDKLSVIDINEAIRVSILDLLYSKGTEPELANKFANMVKNISKEMEVIALRLNETNLFQKKEGFNLKAIGDGKIS